MDFSIRIELISTILVFLSEEMGRFNKDKYKQLDGKLYQELINNNNLKLIYKHFSSLDHFSK